MQSLCPAAAGFVELVSDCSSESDPWEDIAGSHEPGGGGVSPLFRLGDLSLRCFFPSPLWGLWVRFCGG